MLSLKSSYFNSFKNYSYFDKFKQLSYLKAFFSNLEFEIFSFLNKKNTYFFFVFSIEYFIYFKLQIFFSTLHKFLRCFLLKINYNV